MQIRLPKALDACQSATASEGMASWAAEECMRMDFHSPAGIRHGKCKLTAQSMPDDSFRLAPLWTHLFIYSCLALFRLDLSADATRQAGPEGACHTAFL